MGGGLSRRGIRAFKKGRGRLRKKGLDCKVERGKNPEGTGGGGGHAHES